MSTHLQKEDFSKWYLQTIQRADLMDYSVFVLLAIRFQLGG